MRSEAWAKCIIGIAGSLLLFCESTQANDFEAHYGSLAELGVRDHTGQTGKSFTSAIGPYLYFQSGVRKGVWRPNLGVAFEFISGNATIASGAVSGSVFTGGIYPGIDIYPLKTETLQPFVEFHALAAWNYASLSPVIPKSAETSLSLGFGFQAGAGIDYKMHDGHRAFRLHACYLSSTANIAGQPGFQLNAYAASLGLAF